MAASSRTTAGGSPDNACTQGVPARWAKQATDDMAGSERRALVRAWLSGESCVPVAGARDGGHGLRGREAYHPPEKKLDKSRHGDLGYSWDRREVA